MKTINSNPYLQSPMELELTSAPNVWRFTTYTPISTEDALEENPDTDYCSSDRVLSDFHHYATEGVLEPLYQEAICGTYLDFFTDKNTSILSKKKIGDGYLSEYLIHVGGNASDFSTYQFLCAIYEFKNAL